jgi:pimeloyl-ACP methyl ester carboxylesterase
MVLPGGAEQTAPDDLRQLTPHGAERVTLPGGAGPLAALDTGAEAGPTVLMVAGYTGSKEDFAPLLDPLADAGTRVVSIDQRGQYESPGPDDPAQYTVEALAADVVAVGRLLREQGAAPLHLLGHSFGGLVVRAAVLAEPALFDSLVLMGSGPAGLTGPRAELLAHLSPLLDAGGVPLVHETLTQLRAADPRAQEVPPPVRAFLDTRFLANSGAGLRGMRDAMLGEPDRVAELAATGLPVLVAHGVDDDAWLPPLQADMARRLGARHAALTSAAHSPAIENPADTVAVLRDFWSDVRPGALRWTRPRRSRTSPRRRTGWASSARTA